MVVTALERLSSQAPPLPSGLYEDFESRAADALVELAGVRLGADSDADRATVVVHVDHDVLHGGEGHAELEHGVELHPESARRLCCDARLQVLLQGQDGSPLGVGRSLGLLPRGSTATSKRGTEAVAFRAVTGASAGPPTTSAGGSTTVSPSPTT